MKISDDRISHLSHIILDKIWRDDLVEIDDERRALEQLKSTISNFFNIEDEIENAVLGKLKGKIAGSRDYEILYRKFYQEEAAKRKW